MFERYQPDLVVGAGLGYFQSDEVVFQEAVRRGVRTAALVSGWDNPTSKGYRAASLDLIVAWSEQMREEIVRLHDVRPDRVKVGGAPHWDMYLSPTALPSRDELCTWFGLDPSKRIVLHAAFPPSGGVPVEAIATQLAEATTCGALGTDVELVIRLHPIHMNPKNEKSRRPYETLATMEGVQLNYPEVAEVGPLHESTFEDGRVLGALLKHCDVLVNVFSTTTLEAFLLDRPVVMAMPAPLKGRPGSHSYLANPLLWTEFVHLQPLVDSGAARIAHSGDELVRHVRDYLEDPSLDRARRGEIALMECGPTDGHAGERTAQLMLDELGVGTRGGQHVGTRTLTRLEPPRPPAHQMPRT